MSNFNLNMSHIRVFNEHTLNDVIIFVCKAIENKIDSNNYKISQDSTQVTLEISLSDYELSNLNKYQITIGIYKLIQEEVISSVYGKTVYAKMPLKKIDEMLGCKTDYKIVLNIDKFRQFYFNFQKELRDDILSIAQTVSHLDNKRYLYKDLLIDLNRGILKYKDYQINISPDNKPIKFLILLMEEAEYIVEYKKITEKLDLSLWKEESKKDIAREIQYLRRDLGTDLKDSGLNKSAVNKIMDMIKIKRGYGYILKKD